MMRIGSFPFNEAIGTDNHYRHLYYNRPDLYWKEILKTKIREEGLLTKNFMVLLEGMLKCDPQERYTIDDIKQSEWYQGVRADERFYSSLFS